ncbi:MAG TPA: glycosyltransferase, partial [Saprospiraceae bacterium]|nr:glycosyltransferase [Saprospiraceae bacterium]
ERAADFINQHSLMVVPLLSGGGMRAKILEGMALGKVALSTRIGMEGIAARHKKEALLADTPAEFAEAIAWCYEQGGALAQIGDKARRLCAEDYDNLAGARRLLEAFHAARAEGVGAAR